MTEIKVWFWDSYVYETWEMWAVGEIEEPHDMDQLREHYTKTPISFDTEDEEFDECEDGEDICMKVREILANDIITPERDEWAEENMDYPRSSMIFLDIIQIGDEFYYPKKEGEEVLHLKDGTS